MYETCRLERAHRTSVRRFEDLPAEARRYVERIEALVGVPIDVISVGPGRDQTIVRHDPFAHRRAR